jgi:beta-glucosidase
MVSFKFSKTACCFWVFFHAALGSFGQNQTGTEFRTVANANGPTLGYSTASGISILTVDGLKFKDLNKNGKLDPYEDWRLPVDVRARDLASKMSIEQIAGLMLYSAHQAIPANARGFGAGTYNGKPLDSSGMQPYDISDQQKKFLKDDNLRHILVTRVLSPEVAAKWNNNVQAFVEGLGLGIPANNSSDPRNGVVATTEYNLGAGGTISMWPESIGMAATFDPSIVENFGSIAAQEYRALGITTALSPQVDLATEPRWSRFNGTFGENPKLAADMARAYVDGFQTSTGSAEIANGWGYHSVNAMVKHWPSGSPEEGGRDAHYAYGKFAVYPGNNFQTLLTPFVDGAFKLNGKTRKVAAVMPYYTISYGQDKKYGENVGNSYSKYIITDLLRDKYGYDGVVCTDWLITADEGKTPDLFAGKPWGVEKLSVAERHYKVLMAGVDQFGGNNAAAPVLEAYQMGVKEHGEEFMRKRFERSAVRLLRNIFQVGLFENPYLDPALSSKVVGNAAFMKAGYEAQLKSIVLLKNKGNVLPLGKSKTIYVPKRLVPAARDFFGNTTAERIEYPVNMEILKKYYTITEDPTKADMAIVFVKGPSGGPGYSKQDRQTGGNGYVPISLQYGPYTATAAREKSIAAGDPVVDSTISNRSYKGKTTTASNYTDLKAILDTKAAMNGKPVVVCMALSNPAVVAEFESSVDGLIVSFGVQDQALFDILSGSAEPSGLLPLQMPADMQTVEEQKEDVPLDMRCYKDMEGHRYDFGYGLNWKGVINDQRTAKYK